MKRATSWLAVSAAVLAAGWVQASEPAKPAAVWPLWDGKESVADYAKRAGIKDVEVELDLGRGVVGLEDEKADVHLGSNVMMKLTLVPAGKFLMGAREQEFAVIEGVRTLIRDWEEGIQCHEVPRREVTISKPFYMGVYEVTQEQYLQIMKTIRTAGHATLQARGKTLPVDATSWDDAAMFCKKVSALTGRTVTLATEAQWEYACRAGGKERFCFGNDEDELYKYANYASKTHKTLTEEGKDRSHDDGFDGLAPVGSFQPNKFGLYDMHGNVSEWVSDWMGDDDISGGKRGHSYKNAGTLDPTGPEPTWDPRFGIFKVGRGGSYQEDAAHCRSAARPLHGHAGGGIRVVMTLK